MNKKQGKIKSEKRLIKLTNLWFDVIVILVVFVIVAVAVVTEFVALLFVVTVNFVEGVQATNSVLLRIQCYFTINLVDLG